MREDLIFDIGLHNGDDTDYYLRKGFSVVAIEARPDHVAAAGIRFRGAINRGQLHVVSGAIAPASVGDKVILYTSSKSDWGTISPAWAARNEMLLGHPNERIEVKRVDIGEIYRLYGIPFLLKVDIEGLDRFVLEELKGFQDRPRYVSMELDKIDFSQVTAEMDLLKDLGYTKFKAVQQATICGMKIKTRTLDGHAFEYEFSSFSSGPFGNDLPPPWLTYDDALREYRKIFHRYNYFGDYSPVRKLPRKLQKMIRALYRITSGYDGPLPGWYDTHASL